MISTPNSKSVYVVLGMARSGTSAIARALKTLDIDLGKKLAEPEETWNPKGFWEDTDIVYKVNRGVLFALNYTWMSVNRIDDLCKNNKELVNLKRLAIDLLKERFIEKDHWGFKDPRTAKILPFWQEVFHELNLNENYIIAYRNPLSSAYSYQRVSGSDIEMGLLLWLMHIVPAIEGVQGKKCIVVSYEHMLQEPQEQLIRLQNHLGRQINKPEFAIYSKDFLDKNLRHFSCSDNDLIQHSACRVLPFAVSLHQLMSKLARDEITLGSEEFKSKWAAIKKEFDHHYSLFCYLDVWQKRHKHLERELRSIKRSVPWVLTYPLRIIDDILRSRRQKSRALKRLVKSL